MLTLQEALVRATGQLTAHPKLRADALADAVLLLRHVLGVSRATLIAHPERPLDREQQAVYQALIERRLTCEPMQYILGTQEFYGLTLRVTPAVLIPRPETETLVEAVLTQLPQDRPVRVVDVGTGSGAIAIALAHMAPNVSVTAVDLSSAALEIAQQNAAAHGLSGRIRFIASDLLASLAADEPYDAIISNPPYIPDEDAATLHPQVLEHEPAQALFAGPMGVDAYLRLIPQAHTLLVPGGLLALEFGYGQQAALADLLEDWTDVSFIPDLQHIPRVALARRS